MKKRVFIDGQAGTTGLEIVGRLEQRPDLEVLTIDEELRKDTAERRRLLNDADFVFLCLPDDAARQSVELLEPDNDKTRVLDASTAHRTHPDWAYGLPELSTQHRQHIVESARVAIPGCHATGFNLSVFPLVEAGLLDSAQAVTCTSLTGYSGGGKKMIAEYESADPAPALRACRPYALGLGHKHVPEMQHVSRLKNRPIFQPIVGNYYKGIITQVPLFSRVLKGSPSASALHDFYATWYEKEHFVSVMPFEEPPTTDGGYLDAQHCNDTNQVQLFVFGDHERIMVCARFDNLGKGASGAAVQCLNLMLGVDPSVSLRSL